MSAEKDHLAAVIAAMGGSTQGAYSLGDLAKLATLPTSYNEVHVMERLGDGPRRSSEPSTTQQWRVFIRAVSTSYANAQEMRKRSSALIGKTVTVDGESSTEIERAVSDDPIAPDDGWWSGTSEFGYAL